MRSWVCLTPEPTYALTHVWGLLCEPPCSRSHRLPQAPWSLGLAPHSSLLPYLPPGACKASQCFQMPLEVLPGLRIPMSPQLSPLESGPAPPP